MILIRNSILIFLKKSHKLTKAAFIVVEIQ